MKFLKGFFLGLIPGLLLTSLVIFWFSKVPFGIVIFGPGVILIAGFTLIASLLTGLLYQSNMVKHEGISKFSFKNIIIGTLIGFVIVMLVIRFINYSGILR